MIIDLNTKLYLSLSSGSSSNGVYFYNALFRKYLVNAIYVSAPTSSINGLLDILSGLPVGGAAIAAPYKEVVLSQLKELSDVARATGSVNCIRKNSGGSWLGHNTDALGIINVLRCLVPLGERIRDVVVNGAGGVVPSLVYALRQISPRCSIFVYDRSGSRRDRFKHLAVEFIGAEEVRECDLFVNATPIHLDDTDLLTKRSSKARTVFDLRPSQRKHAFEFVVEARGQKLLRGFDFYLHQLLEQFVFFTGNTTNMDILKTFAAKR